MSGYFAPSITASCVTPDSNGYMVAEVEEKIARLSMPRRTTWRPVLIHTGARHGRYSLRRALEWQQYRMGRAAWLMEFHYTFLYNTNLYNTERYIAWKTPLSSEPSSSPASWSTGKKRSGRSFAL